jgi:hypothetical protein
LARVAPTEPKPNKRRARVQIDHRYAIGRRVKELVDVFRARIGPDADDLVMSTAIRRCAETVALSEDLRARMLRGEAVSADDVLRTTRAASRLRSPCFVALYATTALPAGVRGPVLFNALRRFASAWRVVVMVLTPLFLPCYQAALTCQPRSAVCAVALINPIVQFEFR